MATLILGAAGAAIGGAVGGTLGGIAAPVIGRAIGSVAGGFIDQRLLGAGGRVVETARVEALRVQGAREGTPIQRVFGRMRVTGTVIWARRFREHVETTRHGGKWSAPRTAVHHHTYSVSFALALCEGPIDRIGRIWADGHEVPPGSLPLRLHRGAEDAQPDPLVTALEGAGRAPAFRGVAYLVFEDLDLSRFGNRLPHISVEVFREARAEPGLSPEIAPPLADLVEAVALSPGSGEFSLETEPVLRRVSRGVTTWENVNTLEGRPDLLLSLDQLKDALPACRSVLLIVSWFGTDLRAGHCRIMPGVENRDKHTEPVTWAVAGLGRDAAHLVSRDANGGPVYGGTPTDRSVIACIRALKARGYRVVFYPFILMDIPPGNGLPDPFGGPEQAAFPWRGRITLDIAPGLPGSPDKTADAGGQAEAFLGQARPDHFVTDGEGVRYSGPDEWSLRRFILHCAALSATAGGVDAFCIGSELRGLTQIRTSDSSYPFVDGLRALAADVRTVLGAGTILTYAADWSEYFGHHPQDGSGDAIFHLDPLWAEPTIDVVAIDNYMPLSDWREGAVHADSAAGSVHSLVYLQAGVEGGEGHDWYYASEADREAQRRTPITDGRYGEPWIWRYKDLRSWWSEPHHDRIAGRRRSLLSAGNNPRDGAWSATEGADLAPVAGRFLDVFDDAVRIVGGGAWSSRMRHAAVATAIGSYRIRVLIARGSSGFGRVHLDCAGGPVVVRWNLDTRQAVFTDQGSHAVSAIDFEPMGDGLAWLSFRVSFAQPSTTTRLGVGPGIDREGQDIVLVAAELHRDGVSTTPWVPRSKPIWFTELGCPAIDKGANQPNVFLDPKSSESQAPHFSDGREDASIQRRHLQAVLSYWRDPARNPVSPLYGGPMIATDWTHVWTWDARPWPDFPARTDVWSDGPNHRLGHWITGRMGASGLAETVWEICAAAGLRDVDVSALHGLVEGYLLDRPGTARAALQPLMMAFGFDAVESGGGVRFLPRGARPVATIAAEAMVARREGGPLVLTRTAFADVPRNLRLAFLDADANGAPAIATAGSTEGPERWEMLDLPLTLPAHQARAILSRWLSELKTSRDTATFALSPAWLSLEPGDVVLIDRGAGSATWRIDRLMLRAAIEIEATRVPDPPPVPEHAGVNDTWVMPDKAPTPPEVVFLDLPMIDAGVPVHQPWIAARAEPWQGPLAVYAAEGNAGYRRIAELPRCASVGILETALPAARPWRWANGSLIIAMPGPGPSNAAMRAVLNGANRAAVAIGGLWEIIQFREVEPLTGGRYRLGGFLRGQAFCEETAGVAVPPGARIVLLDAAVVPLPLRESDLDVPLHYRVGPAWLGYDDPAFLHMVATATGRGLQPPGPVHGKATAHDAGVEIVWTGRSAADADLWRGVARPGGSMDGPWRVRVRGPDGLDHETVTAEPRLLWLGPRTGRSAQIAQIGPSGIVGPELEIALDG